MEWISIEERNPPQDVRVLVNIYDHRKNVKMSHVEIAIRYDKRWFYPDRDEQTEIDHKYGFVTHWMPLPDTFEVKDGMD